MRNEFETLEQLGAAFEALPLAVLIVDSTWRVVLANSAAARLLTFTQRELLTMRLDDLVPEQLKQRYSSLREEAVQRAAGVLEGERVLRGKDGSEFAVQVSVVPVAISGIQHSLISAFDTTTQKRKEHETLERLRSIMEHSEASIFLLEATQDGAFVFESFNVNVERLMGLKREQASGRRAEQIFPHEQAQRMNDNYARCAARGEPTTYEEWVGLSGRCRLFRTTLVPVRDVQGRVYRIVGIAHDITEQREAEGALEDTLRKRREADEQARVALERSERRFSVAFEASPDALIIVDAEQHRFIDVNREFEELFELSRGDVMGKTSFELGIWEDPQAREQMRAHIAREGSVKGYPLVGRSASGRRVHCSVTTEPLELEGKSARLVVIRDVSEAVQAAQTRGLLEQQLRQAQKMEALGTFAGGIAHDFNNVLAAMLTNAELIKMDAGDSQLVLEHLGELLEASERAKDLVRRILTFSRRQPQQRRRLRVDVPLRESVRLLRSMLPSTININTEVGSELPFVLADETQFQQIMMNLGANAGHAIGRSAGDLTIRLEAVQADAELCRKVPELKPLRYARISVSDTGHGIAPEDLARIFEPFFTTKPVGEGTGLGLAVVYGIVRDHEGVIAVESELGRGSSFTVYLPEVATEFSTQAVDASAIPKGNGETILLVEDEHSLRRATSTLLNALGYRMLDASSPLEALRLIDQGERFDLLLTDLTMPGMTGIDLTLELHRSSPHVPVVVMSGYVGAYAPESLRALGIAELVTKPLNASELATSVAKALATRR